MTKIHNPKNKLRNRPLFLKISNTKMACWSVSMKINWILKSLFLRKVDNKSGLKIGIINNRKTLWTALTSFLLLQMQRVANEIIVRNVFRDGDCCVQLVNIFCDANKNRISDPDIFKVSILSPTKKSQLYHNGRTCYSCHRISKQVFPLQLETVEGTTIVNRQSWAPAKHPAKLLSVSCVANM